MKRYSSVAIGAIITIVLTIGCTTPSEKKEPNEKLTDYSQLVEFFHKWRAFQKPVEKEGVPNYTVE